ncbi:Toxic anion resistance family protein [Candidatus Competibacter denitrificans Run_A_D11]|uniref:Toxic anion resistance family protein n=1 Tax=Candidatus Competibacter denitrificans Run_A_D11 TaxID=1400863 RepID=W6M8G3_9GAMM|nr:toxic anion resistance protein [Candidatus Competibacter denitrificans]CDI02929.1 Toxic anion resistance family protein [Candidatus Competibacter denitrificans Run_A_D11]HRC68649.1 toxic anion resistance protein [Candidatus Competibacter denitrificans]
MSTTPESTVTPTATATPPALPALPDVFAAAVPQVQQDLAKRAPAPAQDRQQVDALMKELDLHDSNSIIFFGSKAQEQLTTISDKMLEGVRNKDTGPAGASLNEMVAVLRGFDLDELDPNKKPGFFTRLFNKAKPLVKIVQQYETVRNQIDTISDSLERHKTQLLTDVAMLDRLYDANLDYFHTLELYIAAGDAKLQQVDTEVLPTLEKEVAAGEDMVKAQSLRDLRASRDDLERRVYDLKLTRQVTMQSLPSIRLVQENDKGLINKINSTLVNTVPLWRQQLAQAITIYRSGEAAKTVKAATDLTNDLLKSNAENLRQANAQTRAEIERGVFDIETVKQANETLIATIEDSLRIADEGRRHRKEATAQLETLEGELRQALSAAHARTQPPAGGR